MYCKVQIEKGSWIKQTHFTKSFTCPTLTPACRLSCYFIKSLMLGMYFSLSSYLSLSVCLSDLSFCLSVHVGVCANLCLCVCGCLCLIFYSWGCASSDSMSDYYYTAFCPHVPTSICRSICQSVCSFSNNISDCYYMATYSPFLVSVCQFSDSIYDRC